MRDKAEDGRTDSAVTKGKLFGGAMRALGSFRHIFNHSDDIIGVPKFRTSSRDLSLDCSALSFKSYRAVPKF